MKRKHIIAAVLVSGVGSLAYAATPTVAELLDVESTLTLKKMQQDVAKEGGGAAIPGSGPASLAGVAPPLPPAAAAAPAKTVGESAPKRERAPEGLVARFGVGSDVGGYLSWDGNTYSVRPGAKVKGYTVVSVNDDGVDLKSPTGKPRHFGSLIDSMPARDEQQVTATRVTTAGAPPGGLGLIPSIPTMSGAR